MVRLFIKNQVKLKIKNLKSGQLLYRNAQLNFNNLVPRVVSCLEDSGEDSVLPLCSRSKKLNVLATKVELYHFEPTKLKIIYIIYSMSESNYNNNYTTTNYTATTIVTQFAEIRFYLFFTGKRN